VMASRRNAVLEFCRELASIIIDKCGAAMAVRELIPGTYISRWAPCVRTHELGQGQLPSGS